jgi:ubiquinone/menaquinone biosynthesis C-methylase UbiE
MSGIEKDHNGAVSLSDPFVIDDLLIFDNDTLRALINDKSFALTPILFGKAMHDADARLAQRIASVLTDSERDIFSESLAASIPEQDVIASRRQILSALFWELTYWKTPELYEELTEGENIHPGIFENIHPYIKDKIILDAGAGSGRASIECLRHDPKRIYAIERSKGLLHILKEKIDREGLTQWILPKHGEFTDLPLEKNSVDTVIACSSFTSKPEQGGKRGLKEFKRVTRPNGMIIIIWPNENDLQWFLKEGFTYEALPVNKEMSIRFKTLGSAIRMVKRFYKKNIFAMKYVLRSGKPEVPFSVLGVKPPHDYCWLQV